MQLPSGWTSRGLFRLIVFAALLVFFCAAESARMRAQIPQEQPAATAPTNHAAPSDSKKDSSNAANSQEAQPNAELASQDHPATFKVRVNLVLVRVVVRDNQGQIVNNLHKEDFQLFDGRKPQIISSFSVETPATQALKASTTPGPNPDSGAGSASAGSTPATPDVKLPQRFVAVMFDDIHMSLEDTTFVRDAATRLFGALAPSDRVGFFSTSGQVRQPFTADRESLKETLKSVVPKPTARSVGMHDCPEITYYQADLIENRHDTSAEAVATEDAVQCAYNGDETKQQQAAQLAEVTSKRVLSAGDEETEYAYRHMEDAMRQLENMPGQRVMVLISPGFIPSTLWAATSGLIDRATHAGVVINTIDARGLWTPDVMGDIADPPTDSVRTRGFKSSYRVLAQSAQEEVLGQLAAGTGGTFFHNRNDVDRGIREAVAAPSLSYVLGFSPQNLKIDGRFHSLKVSLTNKQKYSIQARNGYYAPRTIPNPDEAAKQEIREAIFSQEEMTDVPADLQTQFFKTDATTARLSVLTHLDLKGIHFQKADGRNRDSLVIAMAIFDDNGNLVTGGEKTVQMKLLDSTYNRLSGNGITLKSSFDVKPGSYLVRMVVRDGDGSQMAARNGAVVIPN
jgi:VWFA-related protein